MTRIGILAGGGRLPLTIAESVTARGQAVHIVAIKGEADPAIEHFPHTWVDWGQIGRMVMTLQEQGVQELVIAGGVTRPNLRRIRPDMGFFTSLPHILSLLAGGDDSVLTRVVRFFEGKGLTVRGVHEVAPDLLAGTGPMGPVALSDAARRDAELGFAVRQSLAAVDAGQAVVAAEGRVLAVEGAEGTDAMLERVAALPGRAGAAMRTGVLAKGPKPRQELRVDMPAIGPRTIERAAAAGLAAVAVEAGAVLVLDRAETVRTAEAARIAVHGLPARRLAGPAVHPGARQGRLIGRRRPGPRDLADIETGLAAVESLAPFAAGAGVVVVRKFLLAIEGAEGTAALLERAGKLRQWGLKRRKVGVLVCRAEATQWSKDGAASSAILSEAAAQGLAGVAVSGTAPALGPYEDVGRLADDLGLFLVLCQTP
jgi:DUF1009 family protein